MTPIDTSFKKLMFSTREGTPVMNVLHDEVQCYESDSTKVHREVILGCKFSRDEFMNAKRTSVQ